MIELIVRPTVRVPADTDGQDKWFTDLGFRFISAGDPLYRIATLPTGWRARGLHPLQPLDVVDQYNRLRVVMTYGARPALRRNGSTTLLPAARMRLVTVQEYLARAVSFDAPIIPDRSWATPEGIRRVAVHEAQRAERTAAEFRDRRQKASQDHYTALADTWSALAAEYTPTLMESAA